MKNRFFKVSIILVMILTMTMSNFVLVGNYLISYAADNIATNHQNVEFEAYFKNKEGKELTTLETSLGEEATFLYLRVNVKKEGYFNGEITLENSNFTLKSSESSYVNKIENNTIYLNQMNMGVTEEIKVEIEPIKEENYTIGLLNMTSKVNIKGIYRDSTEKDINIKASRELKLEFVENNTNENVINEMKLITNKILEINGEEKRVLQFSYDLGLQENNYPIKEIQAKIKIPSIEGKQAEVTKLECLNNMKTIDYKYDGTNLELVLKNEISDEEKVLWKTQGKENIIITCIYDKEVQVENLVISAQEKLILYNDKELETEKQITIGNEEVDSVIEINIDNAEEIIYKGKIYADIDRQYQSKTQLKINLAKAIQNIVIEESNNKDGLNVIYQKTKINKEQFDKLFGSDGKIIIYGANNEIIETITSSTSYNQDGNIEIVYQGENVTEIRIETTEPLEEGTLEMYHTKIIKSDKEIARNTSELKSKLQVSYNNNDKKTELESTIKLENTITKATLEISKESLSTVVDNNVEIKTVLVTNNEKYDLYQNPKVSIKLPEEVENITINSIDLLYENELKIRDYMVEGKVININLEGQQTQYKEEVIEGATIVINATIQTNKKATTKEELIEMTYSNENGSTGTDTKSIKIVAPTDITTIHSIKELGIETLGQEETKQVDIKRGEAEKQLETQIEIINNNENSIEDVKILGDLPTNHDDNNMGIQILEGISLTGVEGAKIYYSENENATEELEIAENGWEENIIDSSRISKYLIIIENIAEKESIQGRYTYKIPENLEYNQVAKMGYSVKYINSDTKVASELTATSLEMQTGIGPEVETKLVATMGGKEITRPVKNGEVIQYKIEVSNTGTEDITNVRVIGNVPEGTTMVEPEDDYEYTGASYYKELDNKTYETIIDSLKVGETIYKEYEVRVNKGVAEGTILSNTAKVSYADVSKETEEITNVTAKGDLSVVVKRITDRNVNLYTSGVVQYFAIVENISDEKQENVKVQTNISKNLQIERLLLITGMEKEEGEIYLIDGETEEIGLEEDGANVDSNVKSEELVYSEEINIGTLEPGEVKVLSYDMLINPVQNSENQIDFSVTAKNKQEEYQSNNWNDEVSEIEVGISMTSNTQSQYVKEGDVITYTITVENKTDVETNALIIKDDIPTELTVNKVTVDGEEIEGTQENAVELHIRMRANTTSVITIEAIVDRIEGRDTAEAITNIAYAEIYGEKIATTSEMTHIIQTSDDSSNITSDEEENKIEDNDIAKGNKTITGIAWYDKNANGQKEQGEETLSNIKVRLLNTETNNLVKDEEGKVLEVTTNENGVYVLDKIGNGKYIVIFDYDTAQYKITKYKVAGLSEEENSDAIVNELLIENEKKEVASTDILEIKDNNISNINIGLIQLENFDLKLDKYISRILIQNSSGTTIREYDNATMAKVELDAKQINGSTVIIEYQIKVTNNGEVEGYAKKIADYAPSDLKFSSELNKDWYQVGNVLYTASLANEKIKSGETKTVTLTLTKTMTEDNTGLIANTAEIAEDYNELEIADSNSTPGNRINTENDFGSAEVLLSIRTGGIVYIAIVIIIIALLGATAVVIVKKRKEQEKK